MAACAGDIVDEGLDREEINIALSLSEALQADEVEKFLVLYDSIPSCIATERVSTIKEMARQLAALPKKQFELYRSKKVLSGEHSLLCYGGSWNLKGKLGTEYVSDSAILEMTSMQKGIIPKSSVPTPATKETLEEVIEETSTKKRKKKKSKKSKSQVSVDLGQATSSNDKTVDLTASKMEEKLFDVAGGKQLSVLMNKDVVVDISTNCEDIKKVVRENDETDTSSQHEKNENVPTEFSGDKGKTEYFKDPPFGFPPSPEKIFMSALGLLPTSSINSADASLIEDNPSKRTNEGLKTTDQKAVRSDLELNSNSKEECTNEEKCNKTIFEGDDIQKPQVETHTLCLETEPRQELHDSLTSPPGDFMLEADSIDGDVSSSSAKEDEGEWQSQTKRPYRKKKRELAARAGREKIQMERNQRKWEHRQHFEHMKKNNYHKKIGEDKKPIVHKEVGKNLNQYPGNASNSTAHEEQASASMCVHTQSGYKNVSSSKTNEESSSNNGVADADADATSKKTFSYRDALLKSRKTKEENHYSSDSGVDANSVSSCESVPQPESPKQAPFNHEDVTNYLKKSWQGILDDAKKGLVSVYRDSAYPAASPKWHKNKKSAQEHGPAVKKSLVR